MSNVAAIRPVEEKQSLHDQLDKADETLTVGYLIIYAATFALDHDEADEPDVVLLANSLKHALEVLDDARNQIDCLKMRLHRAKAARFRLQSAS